MATESRREMCGAFLRVESEVGEAAEKRGRLRDWGSHGKKRKGAQGSPCHGKTEEGEKMKAKAVEKEWGGGEGEEGRVRITRFGVWGSVMERWRLRSVRCLVNI